MGLSSLLMLAALVLATGVRHDAGPPAEATTGAWRRVGALGLCAFLAPLARETALVLPAVLVLWQWTLGPREPWRRGLSRHAPVWIGAGAAALVLAASSRHRHLVAFSLQVRDPLEALRGNVHAVTEMLSFWVRPWAISLDPPGPPALGWTAPETVAKAAGLAAAGVFAILGRRRWPLAAFATGWTLLQLVPTNSVVWRIDPVAVKPLYLASLGPAIAVAWVLGRAGRSPGLDGATLRPILATVLIGALAAGTVWRNAQYASPVALWDNTVRLGPGKARPRVNLGFAYLDAGRLDEAAREFAAALEVEPWNREARVGLAVVEVHRAPGPGAARRNSP